MDGEKLDFDRIFHVPFQFGLKAQGHVPTIETMLSEGKTWKEIGKKIGWCPKTAQKYWGWYLEQKAKEGGE